MEMNEQDELELYQEANAENSILNRNNQLEDLFDGQSKQFLAENGDDKVYPSILYKFHNPMI